MVLQTCWWDVKTFSTLHRMFSMLCHDCGPATVGCLFYIDDCDRGPVMLMGCWQVRRPALYQKPSRPTTIWTDITSDRYRQDTEGVRRGISRGSACGTVSHVGGAAQTSPSALCSVRARFRVSCVFGGRLRPPSVPSVIGSACRLCRQSVPPTICAVLGRFWVPSAPYVVDSARPLYSRWPNRSPFAESVVVSGRPLYRWWPLPSTSVPSLDTSAYR